jgi:hypothetical protein
MRLKNDDQTNGLNFLRSNREKINSQSSLVDSNCYLPSQSGLNDHNRRVQFKDYIDYNDYKKIFGIEENQREQDNGSNYS